MAPFEEKPLLSSLSNLNHDKSHPFQFHFTVGTNSSQFYHNSIELDGQEYTTLAISVKKLVLN
jgi:hypothetical protein